MLIMYCILENRIMIPFLITFFITLRRCKIGQCGPCLKDKRGTVASAASKGAKGSRASAATAKSSSASPATAPAATPAKPVDPSRPIGVWLCLRCGLQGGSLRPNFPQKSYL